MNTLEGRTVYALMEDKFDIYFPELRSNEENKHQNISRVNA